MKGLKEFLKLLKEDKKLFSEVEKVQNDADKVVEIAKVHGYEFTEDEYMDAKLETVSGGFLPLIGLIYLIKKASDDD